MHQEGEPPQYQEEVPGVVGAEQDLDQMENGMEERDCEEQEMEVDE